MTNSKCLMSINEWWKMNYLEFLGPIQWMELGNWIIPYIENWVVSVLRKKFLEMCTIIFKFCQKKPSRGLENYYHVKYRGIWNLFWMVFLSFAQRTRFNHRRKPIFFIYDYRKVLIISVLINPSIVNSKFNKIFTK